MDALAVAETTETASGNLQVEPEPSSDEQATWPPYSRPSASTLAAILRLHAEAHSTRQIGKLLDLPQYTVWRTIDRFRSTAEEAKAALHAGALDAAEAWRDTAIPKAANKGDHRPAMDLLKAAGIIENTPNIQQILLIGGPQEQASQANPWQRIEAKAIDMQAESVHDADSVAATVSE